MADEPHFRSGLPATQVGPFHVADCSPERLLDWVATARGRTLVFALHIGGLNLFRSEKFRQAMSIADCTYADGASVGMLARAGGARDLRVTPTTDFGWLMLEALQAARDRPLACAIVGGRPGVADAAAASISARLPFQLVASLDGYAHPDRQLAFVQELKEMPVDVLIVGLGMPREAYWVQRFEDDLPDCVVLTCGGWLNFLAGRESRAPRLMRAMRLEWLFRMVLDPRRLWSRYATGVVTMLRLLPAQIGAKRRNGS